MTTHRACTSVFVRPLNRGAFGLNGVFAEHR
jgi:hypothetical protein